MPKNQPPMPDDPAPPTGEIVLYQTEDGRTRVECRFVDETLWLSQALIAELFQKEVRPSTISRTSTRKGRLKSGQLSGSSGSFAGRDRATSSEKSRNAAEAQPALIAGLGRTQLIDRRHKPIVCLTEYTGLSPGP